MPKDQYRLNRLIRECKNLGIDVDIVSQNPDIKNAIRKLRSLLYQQKPIPKIGTLCTMHVGSDSHAGEVIAVNKRKISIKLYRGEIIEAVRDSEGNYYNDSSLITFGEAIDYRDPSF